MPCETRIAFMSQTDGTLEVAPIIKEEAVLTTRLSPPDEVVFDSLAQKNESPRLHPDWAVFNTAVIDAGGIGKFYISRAVHIPSLQVDVPDANVLVVVREQEKGKFERLSDLNLPTGVDEGDIFNWEDPRVWVHSEGGVTKALLGLTAVRREQNKFVPHPALVEVSVEDGNLKVGETTVFNEVGKNIVPLGDELLYRPEQDNHSLHLLTKPTAEHELALIKKVDFSAYSGVDWLRKKVGTVARPIDIGENLRLLPIHGVRDGEGIDGELKKYIYAVGFAIIDNEWNIQAVSAEPLWTRKDFLLELPLGQGLNGDEKEVVYLEDRYSEDKGEGEDETFAFPLNIGDRLTVIDTKTRSELLGQKWITLSGSAEIAGATGSYEEYSLPKSLPVAA